KAPAADGAEERSRKAADPIPALDPAGEVDVDGGHLRELRDVGAGGERALAAAEHDREHRVVLVELDERRDDRVHQLVRERVQLLRPVHQDDPDGAVSLDGYERLFRNASIAPFASSFSIDSASQSRAWPT